MPAAWPDSLPQRFRVEGTGIEMGDGRIVSQTDTGPGKMRPRSSSVPDKMSASMRMTEGQYATLETFVKTTLGRGTLPFTIPSPRDGSTILVRFARDGLPRWATPGGDVRDVSFQLEILP